MSEQTTTRVIEYISVDKLYPHPENPRKDLGDLSELAESIRAQGILQNLTVVSNDISTVEYEKYLDKSGENPNDPYLRHIINHAFDGYTVIIGHRRLAAAKLAGIEMVPCVVAEMTHQQQVTTMMCENVQRSDLSAYEQAQGFQLMMDLGESVESIAAQTGFSPSTVRRRIKMSELDADTLKKVSAERQITIGDVDRLAEIKDIKTRNKVLSTIGTNNFESNLTTELKKQAREEKEADARSFLEERGGVEVPYSKFHSQDDYKYAGYVNLDLDGYKDELEEKIEGGNLFTFALNYATAYIALYKEETDDDYDEEDEEEIECEQRRKKLDDAFDVAFELRKKFLMEFSEAEAKKHLPAIAEWVVKNTNGAYHSASVSIMYELLGASDGSTIDTVAKIAEKTPYKVMLVCAYVENNDRKTLKPTSYDGRFLPTNYSAARLTYIYDRLATIGYEMSDEERELLDGTSELYLKEEESDDEN